jgi:AcrR family transcriptional regulator
MEPKRGALPGSRRRRTVLATAIELAGPEGFSPSDLPALARGVGMTTSALLQYFGNDKRLFREIAIVSGHCKKGHHEH